MFKKIILPLLVVFLAVAMAIYYWQGGFNKVEITQKLSTTKYVAGRYYEGPARSAEFTALFRRAGELVQSGKVKGNLGGIYYNNPEETKGQIKAFVGIVVASPGISLPQGYELRTLEAGQPILEGKLEANPSLVPGKIYPALFGYAAEQGLTLQQIYLEEYFLGRSGLVWIYLAKD